MSRHRPWTEEGGEMTDESAKDCGIQKGGFESGVGRSGAEGCAGGLKVLGRKRDKDGKGGISERAVG